MKLDDRTLALVAAIRAEANIAAVFGQYERLQAIADDVKKLEPFIREDARTGVNAKSNHLVRSLMLADLRTQVMEKRERWMDEDGDEAAGRRMTYNEMLDLLDGEEAS